MTTPTSSRGVDVPALVVAGLLAALAAAVLLDAASLSQATTYGLGPTAMPYATGGALLLLALGHLVVAFRGGLPRPATALDPVAVGWLTGGLVGLIACIGLGVGFVPATAILFAATARAFGRRALLTDLVIGVVLGVAVYLLFSRVLTLALPQGPLERLL